MDNETGKPGGSAVQEPAPQPWPTQPPAYPPYNYGPPPGWNYAPPRRSRVGLIVGLTVFILFLFGLIGLIVFVTFGVNGWGTAGPTKTETQTVSLGNATSAIVNVNMGVGDLKIAGGGNELMDATLRYNVESWKPIINYSVNGSVGNLTIRQPSNTQPAIVNARYDWDLRFKNDVPLDMRVNNGVGKGDLYLNGLTLTRLEVTNGVGDSRVDLTGIRPQNLNVTIKGGVGKTTLVVPGDIGVRIVTHKGLGSVHASNFTVNGDVYTNRAYGSSTTINIDLNIGVGDIEVQQR